MVREWRDAILIQKAVTAVLTDNFSTSIQMLNPCTSIVFMLLSRLSPVGLELSELSGRSTCLRMLSAADLLYLRDFVNRMVRCHSEP